MATSDRALEAVKNARANFEPRFLGMGFTWAWIYCCWFPSEGFPSGVTMQGNVESQLFLFSFGIAPLVSWLITIKGKPIHSYPIAQVCALIFMVAGTLLHSLSLENTPPRQCSHAPRPRTRWHRPYLAHVGMGQGLL